MEIRKCLEQDIAETGAPDNWPARRFCEKNGFTCAGEADLLRDLDGIPVFSLYELNWSNG